MRRRSKDIVAADFFCTPKVGKRMSVPTFTSVEQADGACRILVPSPPSIVVAAMSARTKSLAPSTKISLMHLTGLY
jgi:hypothetical protein